MGFANKSQLFSLSLSLSLSLFPAHPLSLSLLLLSLLCVSRWKRRLSLPAEPVSVQLNPPPFLSRTSGSIRVSAAWIRASLSPKNVCDGSRLGFHLDGGMELCRKGQWRCQKKILPTPAIWICSCDTVSEAFHI